MASTDKQARYWLFQLGLAALWVVVWQWGLLLPQTPHSSLWFPPAGLSFAMFLTQGPQAWVAVTLASVVTTFQAAGISDDPRSWGMLLASGVAFGIVHSLAYGLGAWLFDRLHGEARLGSPRSVFGFLLFSTGSALLAAVGGIVSLKLTGASEISLRTDVIPWSIGDLVGVVTLAPMFIIVCDSAAGRLGLRSSGWLEGLSRMGTAATSIRKFTLKLIASAVLAMVLAALGTLTGLLIPVALVVYALIVPLTWIAHTEGAIRTVFAVAILASTVALAAALFGTPEQAFNFQAAMIAIAGTCAFNLTVPKLYADNRRLLDLVTFDQLTGAFTRPVFLELAERELQRARRDGNPISVVVLDLDRFKRINDSMGHGTGDRVLARVGSLWRATLREGEVFGRIGGEEFAVLLPNAEVEAARVIAERLRRTLEEAEWAVVREAGRITASAGVANILVPHEAFGSALERADRAMYEAKRAGRNCTRVA